MDKDLEIENLKKALARQILARKEAESFIESKSLELYEKNEELKALISNANQFPEENPNPVMRFSANGHILMYSNKSGNGIIDFIDKDKNYKTKQFFKKQLEVSFLKGNNHQFELRFGALIYSINAMPVISNNYINLYFNEISAMKQANEAVRQSEEKYRGIIENLKLGILEVDNDDKIIKAYSQFCSLSGYDEKELIGKSPTELFLDESSREIMRKQNKDRLKGKAGVYEVPLIKKNGDKAWVIISGAPFYGMDGKPKGTMGIHLDISDRKKMESDLRDAKSKAEELNKIKEMFLANMSHEIRTPMNAIVGMSELLEQTDLDENQTKYLSAISSSSNNLLVLVNDLLDFSKVDTGNLSLELVAFNLNKLIKKTVEIVSLKADKNGVEVTFEIDSNLPKTLKGDPTRLGQVLLNLLSNAVKFTTNGSVIVYVNLINRINNKHKIEFVVKDEGIGIAEEELTNIFKDFKQANDSTSRLYGGTGLGLSISQKIVKLMNGDLEVLSELDKGSEFFFTIELEDAELENSGKELNDNYEIINNFNQCEILLVEDNPVNSLMAITILEKWNCKVDLAENGIESIEKLKVQSYDLILLDMTMPKMGGIEASKIIRNELKIETPIIALTANATKGDSEKCIEAGMNDYLSKPYHQIDLNHILIKWVKIKKVASVETLVNLSKLEAMGDSEFLEKMVNLFLIESEKDILLFKTAIKESNFDQIRLIAHKIKPSIDYICLPRLFDEVKAIEIYEEDDSIFLEKVQTFIHDLELVLKQLRQRK